MFKSIETIYGIQRQEKLYEILVNKITVYKMSVICTDLTSIYKSPAKTHSLRNHTHL